MGGRHCGVLSAEDQGGCITKLKITPWKGNLSLISFDFLDCKPCNYIRDNVSVPPWQNSKAYWTCYRAGIATNI